jgi:hypothetical protein
MNDVLDRRMAAMTGLVLAAAVALWWLGSTRLALDHSSDAGRASADALQALWLARAIALALLGVRTGALRGWRGGAAAGLALIAPAWPLAVLAWTASATPWIHAAGAEIALLGAAAVLPLIGLGLRRALRQVELAEASGTALGAALASALWFARGLWT